MSRDEDMHPDDALLAELARPSPAEIFLDWLNERIATEWRPDRLQLLRRIRGNVEKLLSGK